MLVRTFDMFALSESRGLREGLFGTKYFLAPLPHFCSVPACSQPRLGRALLSLLSFSRPVEGWSQSAFPVVTGTALPLASRFSICPLCTSQAWQRLMGTKSGMVLALQGWPPLFLTRGISLPKPQKCFPCTSPCKLRLSLHLKAQPRLGWLCPYSPQPTSALPPRQPAAARFLSSVPTDSI